MTANKQKQEDDKEFQRLFRFLKVCCEGKKPSEWTEMIDPQKETRK